MVISMLRQSMSPSLQRNQFACPKRVLKANDQQCMISTCSGAGGLKDI